MKTIQKLSLFFSILLAGMLLLFSGCKKYEYSTPLQGAAYIRLFNGITNFSYYDNDVVTLLQDRPVSARLRVYIDPPSDANGILDTAATEDNLYPRTFYYTPQPDQAGNTVYFDVDYPGSKLVQTSSAVNGFDLSRWAAILAGKHHLVFAVLPIGQTSSQQINSARFNTIIDTTINFSEGHYYSIEPVNVGKGFRLYAREDGFEQLKVSQDKIYFRIANLCTARQVPDTFDVYYNYHYFSNQAIYYTNWMGNVTLAGYVEYDDSLQMAGTVNKSFPTTLADAPYMSIPLASTDSSLSVDGSYLPATRRPAVVISLFPHGQTVNSGTTPLFRFVCTENFANLVNMSDTTFTSGYNIPNNYYTPINSNYYLYQTLSYANYNNIPATSCPVAGGLSHYVFISGVTPRNEPLISTIELMDNYNSGWGNGNNFSITSVPRIYTTSVQNKYGNPY